MMQVKKATQPILIALLQAMLLSAGCGNQPADIPEDKTARPITRDFSQEEALLMPVSSTETTESEVFQGRTNRDALPPADKNESSRDPDWGREINVDEMITMAKKGRIVEIQWHVMPNVLRAQASDGNIYHIRNENKGVDLRNTLINAGVKIGKEGVLFRHVF